jgi:hypothetical protein
MAIPSRQIGWDTKDNLLWQISKQLERLIRVRASRNTTTTSTTTAVPTTTTSSSTSTSTSTTTSTPTTTTTTTLPITNSDAYAYALDVIAAGGTIDTPTALALDVLFNDLQSVTLSYNPALYLYNVLEGFYPMLGTTSATQGINANGNTSYDLQFFGGWTFGALGMQGNGINTLAYTGKDYVPVTGEELYNTHFSIYGTVPVNARGPADLSIGGGERTVSISLNGTADGGGGLYEYDCGSGASIAGDSGDFVTISCDNGISTLGYQNGSSVGAIGFIPTLIGIQGLYFGLGTFASGCQTNNGNSSNTYGWSSFGGFMDGADISNYQTIVNTFMTSIGRNTY